MVTQIYNGDILIPGGKWVKGGSVIIKDSTIVDICSNSRLVEYANKYIDAAGGYVLPGGIDLHVHGGGGRDFMEPSTDAWETVIAVHRRHGTTSLFPTVASATEKNIRECAQLCTEMMENPRHGILGMHLEGPYFVPEMVGGQILENIRLPRPEEYIPIIDDFPCIKRWDAAPEIEGAGEFGRFVSNKGVVVSLAHTRARYKDIINAYENGYTLATHFYNAMTTSHKKGIYKYEGTVEAVFLMDGINVEVIADGIHVPPIIMKLIHKFKTKGRMCLITDALAITESPDGNSFDSRVVVENGVCKLRDGSAIAGSCATMDRLIRTAVLEAEIPLEDVSRMVSETPGLIMGVYDRKGSICKRKDADIMIMDKDLNLTHVIAMGEEVDLSTGQFLSSKEGMQ